MPITKCRSFFLQIISAQICIAFKFKNQTAELVSYFEQVHLFYEQTCTYIALGLSEIDKVLLSEVEDKIDKAKRELKKASRKRIENGSNVKVELNYMDIVRKIEKAGDCVFGVIQALHANPSESLLSDGSEKNLINAQNVIINTKSRKVFVSGNEIQLAVAESGIKSVCNFSSKSVLHNCIKDS